MVQNISDPYIRTTVRTLLYTNRFQARTQNTNQAIIKTQYDDRPVVNFFEKSLAVILLIISSPIMLAISAIIFIADGRPIIFKQRRMGHKGKIISIYKFRTMINDAEDVLKQDILLYEKYIANDFKIPVGDDPRLLRFGKFLRRWSIDELPQFINVIKGDMNIVGPRPVFEDQLESYGQDSAKFLSVKPGITGLWQISGRSDIGYPDRKYLDLIYVEHRSLTLDLKIFFKTFWRVFKRNGAY